MSVVGRRLPVDHAGEDDEVRRRAEARYETK
jgi:hypothetical protein